VTEIADELEMDPAMTSAALRTLGARGVLVARRTGREAVYTLEADPTVPEARRLVRALAAELAETDGLEASFRVFTAFTHPRRAQIVQSLESGPLPRASLALDTGMSYPAVCRHVQKLIARGIVKSGQDRLRLAKPPSKLARMLLKTAMKKV
jgi:DNA-binding MarR family transcriptional regulator